MGGSRAPYIQVILSYIVSITWYITQSLVRLTTAHYQSTVSMISFAQVLTAQWSDTIPSWNVQFQVRITSHNIPFQQHIHQMLGWSTTMSSSYSQMNLAANWRKLSTSCIGLIPHISQILEWQRYGLCTCTSATFQNIFVTNLVWEHVIT